MVLENDITAPPPKKLVHRMQNWGGRESTSPN